MDTILDNVLAICHLRREGLPQKEPAQGRAFQLHYVRKLQFANEMGAVLDNSSFCFSEHS